MKHTQLGTTIGPHRYNFEITKTIIIAAKTITPQQIELNTKYITDATNQTHDPNQQITIAFRLKSLNTTHTNEHNNLQQSQWAIHHNNTIYTIQEPQPTHPNNTYTAKLHKNPLLNHKALKNNITNLIKTQLTQNQ